MSDPTADPTDGLDFTEVGPSLSSSIIRTVTPTIVGFVVAVIAQTGLKADSGQVSLLVAPLVSTAYYVGVRWLEEHVNSKFGVLLGKAQAPNY